MKAHLKKYQGKEVLQLSFKSWTIGRSSYDKTGKRATLVLKFWCPALNDYILCYKNIGPGHLIKQGKNAGVARTEAKIGGGFRLTKRCGVTDWIEREEVNIKRLREAHVGFMREMKRTDWNAPVIQEFNSKTGQLEYRTVIEFLKRGRLPDDIPF